MQCIDHGGVGDKDGYLITSGKIHGELKRGVRKHRAVYCAANGLELPDIDGLVVRHHCDNPRCINPKHLLIGTVRDNVQDSMDRNRHGAGERNGRAVLSDEDVAAIRREYVRGCRERGQLHLAKKYGVGRSQISRIVRGEQRATPTGEAITWTATGCNNENP